MLAWSKLGPGVAVGVAVPLSRRVADGCGVLVAVGGSGLSSGVFRVAVAEGVGGREAPAHAPRKIGVKLRNTIIANCFIAVTLLEMAGYCRYSNPRDWLVWLGCLEVLRVVRHSSVVGKFLCKAAVVVGFVSLLLLSSCAQIDQFGAQNTPEERRPAGKIAFIGADGNIYRIEPEAGSPEPVTSDAEHNSDRVRRYQAPTWDPSTNALAYIEIVDETGGLDKSFVHVLPAPL